MSESASREVEHEITIKAPANTVYGLIEDVTNWPHVFPPTIHVERLESEGRSERIRIWATARGEAKTWTSRRELDPEALRITFRQEQSAPPVASMGAPGSSSRSPRTPAGSACCTTTARSATPPKDWPGSTKRSTATAVPSWPPCATARNGPATPVSCS